jgi:hypothetical protein
MIHSNILIIPVTLFTAADIPLCTETIMAKDRITMIMAIVNILTIFHIHTVMINTLLSHAGAMIIKAPGINMTETMIILITPGLFADITMGTKTVVRTDTSAGIIINGLPANQHPFYVYSPHLCRKNVSL